MEASEQIKTIFDGIETWANNGSKDSVNRASIKMADEYGNNIRVGENADGSDMAALKKSTLEGPVRRGSDPTPRNFYGAIPMNASSELSRSIRSNRKSPIEWEIAANTERSDMILSSNAKRNHSGYPFAGDTPKAIRDPLQVSDKQMDIMEDALVEDLEKVLARI